MAKFTKNENPAFADGYIFIEIPHQGPRKVWTAFDDKDLIKIGGAIADRSRADLSAYDMADVDDIIDYVRHDLSMLHVVRFKDVDAEVLDDPLSAVADALVRLEWATEIQDEEEAA